MFDPRRDEPGATGETKGDARAPKRRGAAAPAAAAADRRGDPRLRLSYPIRVSDGPDEAGATISRTVTRNVSARGAYFTTFDGAVFQVGQELGVAISVPHRLGDDGPEIVIDLRSRARVVRIDRPGSRRLYGEDGVALTGIALSFTDPLRFRFAWV